VRVAENSPKWPPPDFNNAESAALAPILSFGAIQLLQTSGELKQLCAIHLIALIAV
jgi:hypothetical protein